jgi:hypothetical protein
MDQLEAGNGGKGVARRSGCGTSLLRGHGTARRGVFERLFNSFCVRASERRVILQAGVDFGFVACLLLSFFFYSNTLHSQAARLLLQRGKVTTTF